MEFGQPMGPSQRRVRGFVFYLLYLTLIVEGSLVAVLWVSGEGPAFRASVAAFLRVGAQPTPAASAVATPPPPATPVPTFTPQPTPTLVPSPTPTPARPRATAAPTRIVAPAIGLDAPVVEIGYKMTYLGDIPVAEWQEPANAAGFHIGSAYPGNPGNTVLSGHNNIQGEVFRYLVDLKAGDEVILYVAETAYHYRVSTKEILPEKGQPTAVRIANAQRIGPTADERLTLVTCWPYTGNSHRVVVTAFPIP